MIKRRATISPLGCFLLGLILAGAMFAVATTDLALPGLDYPKPGERTPVTYRVPSVGVLLELDEKSLYSRSRVEVPVGSKVVEWPAGGHGRRLSRFELPAGSPVHHRDVSFLRALEEHRRPPGLGFSIGLGLLLLGTFLFATHAVRLFVPRGRELRVQLVMMLSLVVWLALFKVLLLLTPLPVFWIPLAALSMTWAILHSRLAGVMVGAVGAVAAGALFPMDWALTVTLAAQACVPPLLMPVLRKRRTPGLSWVGGAVAAVAAYVGYHFLVQGALPAADLRYWERSGLLATVGAAAVSPFIAYALKPLFQRLLGGVSRGKLMELADLDHPLLQQIAAEAPGTWQHTLSMANMAEVVCNAIGANGNLVRVGAYYHDAGKSLNPKYFAENLEGDEVSPHRDLPPEESAGVIFEHVSDGLRLARKHKLPYAVQEFIFMHHGDGLLEFFWHKCQEQGNPRDLPETAFRYPGIPPQNRESAILAIVDAVEAASKSLKKPDADQVDDLIRRIIFGKLKARQLDEAGLSAADLSTVAETLRDILRSQFHVRPEYPWQKKARMTAETEARAYVPAHKEPRPEPAPTPEADGERGAPLGEEQDRPSTELSAVLALENSGPSPRSSSDGAVQPVQAVDTEPVAQAPEPQPEPAPESEAESAPESAPEPQAPAQEAESAPEAELPTDTVREPPRAEPPDEPEGRR